VIEGIDGVDPERMPTHIGCVMDGNGRWAEGRGLPRTEGHKRGEDALFEAVEGALELGVKWLTVYAFSTENWRRPPDEVRFLVNFNEDILISRRGELDERGVRVRFVGRRDWRVPRRIIRRMDETSAMTEKNRRMTLTIAFNYGGRAEIVDAVRALVADKVPAKKIDERAIRSHLYDPEMPDPDLVIRTSGEQRLSDFMLWQSAHSEFYFVEALGPDLREVDFLRAMRDYSRRHRRYGS